jgi:annexin A7/11
MIDDGLIFLHFLPVKKAMILLTTDPAERDAKLVWAALEKKRGDDKDAWVLIEASCASTPDHLIAVRRVYRSLFGCSLEEDVAASSAFQQPLRTVGDNVITGEIHYYNKFREQSINHVCMSLLNCLADSLQLLVSLVRSYRCAEEAVDADVARVEAATLAEAIWRKKQPHGSEVLRIVSTRSKSQLAATFQCYKEEHGSDIEQVNLLFTHHNYIRLVFFHDTYSSFHQQLA